MTDFTNKIVTPKIDIANKINELEEINKELTRINSLCRNLRKRAKELETNIITYLKENDHPGLKYNNRAVILNDIKRTKNKPKTDINNDALDLLYKNGISNPEDLLTKLNNLRKTEEKTQKIKFINF